MCITLGFDFVRSVRLYGTCVHEVSIGTYKNMNCTEIKPKKIKLLKRNTDLRG